MLAIFITLLLSLGATYVLVRLAPLHMRITGDSIVGPQKFHTASTPRVGGLGIAMAYAGALIVGSMIGTSPGDEAVVLLLCSLPALLGGLSEDITKRVGVGMRLAMTMLAAAIGYFALGGVLDRLDVAGLDFALQFGLVSLAFTMVAVGGIANAINIVDGYNGLAGVTSIFILAALAYVCHAVGDTVLLWTCLAMIGALAGFLPWNYPKGKIFLGDGGAYFVGFMIGEISVLLVRRHPEVSPWFPLMLVAYPAWETLFSIYRKKVFGGYSPGDADGLHFHQLVYKRVMRWKVGSKDPSDRLKRNSLTSPYMWALSLTTIVPAVIFWRHTVVLAFWAFGFGFLYLWLYRRMVAFRVPRWLIFHRPRSQSLYDEEWMAQPRKG
jgi:UDP-GlcNAc:undecaprenyl-phosphate/decaprenyl-phosphate GlcNAc-1-phosphate transferase